MSTDRELLELSAKAAGILLDYSIRPDGKAFYHSDRNALAMADGGWFAPLTDDGDALRLAVKLELFLEVRDDDKSVLVGKEGWPCSYSREYQADNSDSNAATRRAIVRAAAEIGRAMP